jgi:hypothetical protein
MHLRAISLRNLLQVLASVVSWGAIFTSSQSNADNRACDYAEVKVVVRSIQAMGARERTGAGGEPTIDDSLTDLKQKLGMLPFSSFKLISSKEEQISLKRKEIVHLPNGQSIAFRPMYMNKERVGLWLSWKDTDGNDILNTRIHFDADESVLTGTDYLNNEGRILAIKAVQVN